MARAISRISGQRATYSTSGSCTPTFSGRLDAPICSSGLRSACERRLPPMAGVRIVDVTDEISFALVPPCADPGFDHRTCDYWEDAERGSRAARAAWLEPVQARAHPTRPSLADNPFPPPQRDPA